MESLPSYKEIKNTIFLQPTQKIFIEKSRQTVRDILNGVDPRLLLIVGPCSIHEPLSAKEFAQRLENLSKEVSSQFFLIMRIYCEKPRTASGWKGFLYDPHLDGTHQMSLGIKWTRELLIELASLQIPAACEFLDPLTAFYYDDLMTWGSIGARTSSSQIHRNLASGLSMPVGIKNGVAGNVSAAVNGAIASLHPHACMQICENGKPTLFRTSGNPDVHVVLRGGESGPNYDELSVANALLLLQQANLPSRLLIDCAHHNCQKKHELQPSVFRSVITQITEGNANIRGLMMESHLFAGKQQLKDNLSHLEYGVSITDSCLDWETTAELIRWGAQKMEQQVPVLFSHQSLHSLAGYPNG